MAAMASTIICDAICYISVVDFLLAGINRHRLYFCGGLFGDGKGLKMSKKFDNVLRVILKE